jgi:magnesium-transporting ATPase (P-type)
LVIGLSVAKEGYEDWKRYKADKQVNESIVLVWRGSSFERCRWQELAVGEIVKVRQTSPYLPP